MSVQPKYLRKSEACERWSLSVPTLDKLIRSGQIRGVIRIGRTIRIPADAIDQFKQPDSPAGEPAAAA